MILSYVSMFLLEVIASIRSNWSGPLFTGRLVKSMLIDSDPGLKPLFTKSKGSEPKPIHLTPLYRELGKRIKCLYSTAKVDTVNKRVKEVSNVLVNGVYKFYIGFAETEFNGVYITFNRIYNALMNINGSHTYRRHLFKVELHTINIIDLHSYAKNIVNILLNKGKIKLIFSSPTLLRDPFLSSKQKSLIPVPINIFSTPVYINLYLIGKFKKSRMMKLLLILHRILNIPYSVYNTISIKWVVYKENKQPIPAITGYVNLYLNKSYYEEYSKRICVNAILREVFKTMLALGVGTSRATGFGHIFITS